MKSLKELLAERDRASTIIIDQLEAASREHIYTVIFFSEPSVKIVGINWMDRAEKAVIILEDTTGFRWQEFITIKAGLSQTMDIMALFGPMITHLAWIDRQIEEAKKIK